MAENTGCKLYYFPVRALAEPIRFLLSYGGIEFEDIRMDREQWKTFKENTPFGQIPVLEVDGKTLHQSVAICRYLGNKVQLVGKNISENAEIDSIVDSITDLRLAISKYNKENTESLKKEALREELITETIPFYLARFNEVAKNGFMALDKLTWADFYFIGLLDYCNGVMKMDILEGYDNLQNLRKNVYNMNEIKEWIEKRPISDY